MIKLKKFNEHIQYNTPDRRKISTLGQDFILESSIHGWSLSLVQTDGRVDLGKFNQKIDAFNAIRETVISKSFEAAIQPINENGTPDWIQNVTNKIMSNSSILKFGAIDQIINHEAGVTMLFNDIEFSDELDSLMISNSLDSDVTLEIIFSDFDESDLDLISLGLQSYPVKYSLEVSIEFSSENTSISEFHSQDSKTWHLDPEQVSAIVKDGEPADAANSIVTGQVVPWYTDRKASVMGKLEKLAKAKANRR